MKERLADIAGAILLILGIIFLVSGIFVVIAPEGVPEIFSLLQLEWNPNITLNLLRGGGGAIAVLGLVLVIIALLV